ncbi:MAG: MarR family transcriptional regulator [Xenococcaceae cyanobacterium]
MNRKLEIYYTEDSVINVFAKTKKYLNDDYARCFLNEILALALDRDFTGTDFRVLLAIIGNLGYDNKINISQGQLGKELNIKRPEITKSIGKLISKGYLQVVDTIGRQNIYQLNPNVAFRSRAKNYKDLCRAWDRETIPNTQKFPIDIDLDLKPDLEDKLDDKVSQLSRQFGVPKSKVRQIILSLVDQALESEEQEESELPY